MTTIPTNTHTDNADGIPATNPAFSDAVNAALEGAVITDGYIDNAATTVATLDSQIETLTDQVSTLQSDKTTLEGQVTALEGDVSTLTDQVDTLQSDKTALEGQVTTLEGQVTALEGDVTTLTDQVSTLQSDKTTLEGQVTALEGQVTALEAHVTDLEAQLAAAGGSEELEALIGALTEGCAVSTLQVAANASDMLTRGSFHGQCIFMPSTSELVKLYLNYGASPARLVLETNWTESYLSNNGDQVSIEIYGISCNISQGDNTSGDIYANGLTASAAASLVADRLNSLSSAIHASVSGATLTIVTTATGNGSYAPAYSAPNVTVISTADGGDAVYETNSSYIVVDVAPGGGDDFYSVTAGTMASRLISAIQADARYNAVAVDDVTIRIYNALSGYGSAISNGTTGFTAVEELAGHS